MIWEYVLVVFPRVRDVFIGGVRIGQTNVLLRLRRGQYTFDLGVPVTYRPVRKVASVVNTSAIRPKIVQFESA